MRSCARLNLIDLFSIKMSSLIYKLKLLRFFLFMTCRSFHNTLGTKASSCPSTCGISRASDMASNCKAKKTLSRVAIKTRDGFDLLCDEDGEVLVATNSPAVSVIRHFCARQELQSIILANIHTRTAGTVLTPRVVNVSGQG